MLPYIRVTKQAESVMGIGGTGINILDRVGGGDAFADVYKRQKRIYAHFILGMTKQDIARAEGVHEKVVRVAIERGPVSYTHLDVYKRQAQRSGGIVDRRKI